MSTRTGLVVALAAAIAATAGAAVKPLTKVQYAALLKTGTARVGKPERAAQLGLARKAPPAEMKRLILAWAAAEKQFGESLQGVRPPANAAAANAQLAKGELTYADELTAVAGHLPSSASAVASRLQKALSTSKGSAMVNQALTKLRIAGYY